MKWGATADRLAIHETIARHGHVADDRDWDRWRDVFTEDLVMDLADFGFGEIHGLDSLRKLSRDNEHDPGQPLGHHVTNIVVLEPKADRVRTRSKGFAVNADGTTGTVVYEDAFRREPQGWRICHRKVICLPKDRHGRL
ncbi:nuclear transport factor 2 family protein [Nocardia yamanashiensis]|uniref:nuclear transport factor 2 family protein n=1 Tax=Nocardia yamanashiensis TaxID=209247 RepID=UPI001E5C4281|nr:nuclear transport factor 2 family protein [Nocardia yamanashiensis]UGT41436.1 nuclear transport factor 2 family protein [Nocardia yamanashiensis]